MKRKIRITAGGIFGAKGEIPIGTEIEVKGDLPAGWAGRFVELGNSEGKELQIGTGDASISSNDLGRLLHEHGMFQAENAQLKEQVEKLTAELAAKSKGDAATAPSEPVAKEETKAEDKTEAPTEPAEEKRAVGRPAGKKS